MPTTAAAYVRISKDAVDLGLGVARQRELCARVAEQHGWTITQVYEDNDLSAYSGKPRPAFSRLVTDIKAGQVEAIVAVDQDRLTRHPRELEDIIDLAVPVALSSGELDLTSSDDRLRARMLGAVARQESEKKSERIRRQKADARARGWWLGRPPFGYRTVPSGDGGRKLEVVPAEAAVVRGIAARLLDGATLLSTARWASEQTGRPWASFTARRAVTRPAVAGWQPDGQQERWRHPETGLPVRVVAGDAVLDEVTWQRCRDLFAGRKRTGVDGRSEDIYLARLVACTACGHVMSASTGGVRHQGSYVCRSTTERPGTCVGNTAVRHRVDALVDAVVGARLATLDPGVSPAAADGSGEVERLRTLLADQEAERRRLLLEGASPDRVAAVQDTVDAIDAKLRGARLVAERQRRTVDLAGIEGMTGPGAVERFLSMEVPDRRRVVRLLVRRVWVAPAGVRTSVFDPARVAVDLAV